MTQVLRRLNLDMTFCFSLFVLSVRVRMHGCLIMMRGGTLNATMSEGLRPDRLVSILTRRTTRRQALVVNSSIRHDRTCKFRAFEDRAFQVRTCEVRFFQTGISQIGITQIRI